MQLARIDMNSNETSREEFDYFLSSYNFGQTCNWLDPFQFRILFSLYSYDPCYPSEENISEGTGISTTKIGRVIKSMEKMDLLSVSRGWKVINGKKTRVNIITLKRANIIKKHIAATQKSIGLIDLKLDDTQEVRGLIDLKLEVPQTSSLGSIRPPIVSNTKYQKKATTTGPENLEESSSSSFLGKGEEVGISQVISEIPSQELPIHDPWSQIIIPGILRLLGFSLSTLKQIDPNVISVVGLQLAIDGYAFDINRNDLLNKNKVKNPITYFINPIKRGEIYQLPSNYKTAQELEIEKIENENKRQEEKKIKEEKRLKQLEYEKVIEKRREEEKLKPKIFKNVREAKFTLDILSD